MLRSPAGALERTQTTLSQSTNRSEYSTSTLTLSPLQFGVSISSGFLSCIAKNFYVSRVKQRTIQLSECNYMLQVDTHECQKDEPSDKRLRAHT